MNLPNEPHELASMLAEATQHLSAAEYARARHVAECALRLTNSPYNPFAKPRYISDWYTACFFMVLAEAEVKSQEKTFLFFDYCLIALECVQRVTDVAPEIKHVLEAQIYYNSGLSVAKNPYVVNAARQPLEHARILFTQLCDAGSANAAQNRIRCLLLLAWVKICTNAIPHDTCAELKDVYDYSVANGRLHDAVLAAYFLTLIYEHDDDKTDYKLWRGRLRAFWTRPSRGNCWLAFRLWAHRPPQRLITLNDFFI